MKSFTLFTMKSKQVWMKSKPFGFDEIKSVFISRRSRISSRSDFICIADLFRRKTDLTEKTANFVSKLTVFSGDPYGIRTHVIAVKGRCLNHLTKGPCIYDLCNLFTISPSVYGLRNSE